MFVRLERLTAELLPQIRAIDSSGLGNFWSLSAYAKELANPYSYLIGAIAAENQLLGFGCLWRIVEEAHITILVVHPDYQGRGIGKLILWGLIRVANRTGAEWAVLEVRASNQKAVHLYSYFGFVEVGNRKNYYQDTGESALILWCKGLQSDLLSNKLAEWLEAIKRKLSASSLVFLDNLNGSEIGIP